MRTRTTQTLYGLLATFNISLAPGCGDRQAASRQSESMQSVNAKEDPAIKELGAKIGIVFPTNSVLLNTTDGGGRDPSYGFHAWGLFSTTVITMPTMKAPGVEDYLHLPLEDTAKFIQGMMGGRRISGPQSAFGSEWETNGFTFQGTVVRTPEGYHLVIEQFRKK